MRKMKKIISLTMAFTMILCLASCGNANRPVNAGGEENIEKEIPESMDASDVADMLEDGMTVDEIIDRVEEEIKDGNVPSTDKPAETASPTQTEKPAATPSPTAEPTAKPTPEPTATPEPTPMHVHQYTAETVTRQATCSTAGERKLTCECGESKTESVPATGQHNWVEGSTVVHHGALGHVAVVRTQTGTTETRHEYECRNCGYRTDTPGELSDHRASFVPADPIHATASTIIHDIPGEPIYEETQVWQVDQEAWDEVVGNGVFTCTVCGATK